MATIERATEIRPFQVDVPDEALDDRIQVTTNHERRSQ
jgi:hypothetical protein